MDECTGIVDQNEGKGFDDFASTTSVTRRNRMESVVQKERIGWVNLWYCCDASMIAIFIRKMQKMPIQST